MAQQPQWSPPPQQPAGWGAPGYGGAPPRPTGVTLASIYLIVMGVLLVLGGAACGLAGGALFGVGSGTDATGVFGVFAGIAVVAGLIAAVLGILQIAAGAGAMGGKGWGRWIGIILSVIFAILFILGGLSALGDTASSGVVSLVIGVLYALCAWAYIQANAYFSFRR